MLKENWLFSERYTKEDKINVTWGPPMDRREDGQPEFGGTCVISRQPAFSIPSESSDYHEKFAMAFDDQEIPDVENLVW